MSALPQAPPLSLSAAVYPPALLVLLLLLNGKNPRRLVLAYYGGAAILTISAGLIALAVLKGAGLTTQSSPTASGWLYILLGLLLLALAAWAWRRRAHEPAEKPRGRKCRKRPTGPVVPSRDHEPKMGVRPRPSDVPSLAVVPPGDKGDRRQRGPTSRNVLAVLICALGVMVFVEVPLVAMFVRPVGVAAGINRVNASVNRARGWLRRNGWSLTAGLALVAGIYAIVTGIDALT